MLSSVNKTPDYTLQSNDVSRKHNDVPTNVNFKDALSQFSTRSTSMASAYATASSSETTNVDSYLSQLQSKFGTKISVQNMEYSKANINRVGSSTSGTGNVFIASNILEKMAADPKARQHYEAKIQGHFDTIGEADAFMAMHGRRIVSSGVIIHPDGKVTYYSSSDYTPEEKARLEKAMKEEDEEKAKRREKGKQSNEILLDYSVQPVLLGTPQVGVLFSNDPGVLFQIPSNIDASMVQGFMSGIKPLR